MSHRCPRPLAGGDPPRHRPQAPQLGTSVEALRGRVNELTDWRRQVEEHKQQLIVGAAAVGFFDRRTGNDAPPHAAASAFSADQVGADAADAEQAGADVGAEDGADLGDEGRLAAEDLVAVFGQGVGGLFVLDVLDDPAVRRRLRGAGGRSRAAAPASGRGCGPARPG